MFDIKEEIFLLVRELLALWWMTRNVNQALIQEHECIGKLNSLDIGLQYLTDLL